MEHAKKTTFAEVAVGVTFIYKGEHWQKELVGRGAEVACHVDDPYRVYGFTPETIVELFSG